MIARNNGAQPHVGKGPLRSLTNQITVERFRIWYVAVTHMLLGSVMLLHIDLPLTNKYDATWLPNRSQTLCCIKNWHITTCLDTSRLLHNKRLLTTDLAQCGHGPTQSHR